MRKMEKNIKKKIKLNFNYLVFISELKKSKLLVDEKNKEKIIKLYSEIVNLRFNNLKRVDFRVKRKELKGELNKSLKELNISENEFKELSNNLRDLSNKKVSNYIVVSR